LRLWQASDVGDLLTEILWPVGRSSIFDWTENRGLSQVCGFVFGAESATLTTRSKFLFFKNNIKNSYPKLSLIVLLKVS